MYRPSYFSYRMPIEVEIFGDDLAQLRPAAAELAHELASVHGLADVTSSLEEGAPEVQIHFDRAALAQYGLDLSEVSNLLKSKIRGEVATALRRADKDVDVRVRVSRDFRARAADVENLIVGQRDGVPILLKAVAELKIGQGPSEIRRLDQRRSAVVTANLSGRDLGSVSRDIRPVLERFNSHGQFLAALSGQNREMLESFASLFFAALLAVFLVYLVMASEFESFLHPFVILLSVPLGLAGAVAALVLTGTSMDVMVLIGLVMLAGIVVNNAIVLIDFTNQLREGGMTRREALVQAGRTRLRPILMTTGTTVLGLLPMALGIGEGAELRAPLAITVIGGLTGATLLTLVVIPVIYDLLDRKPSGGAR
jgi:HAE1 family hydrophobic/amphiphilic exporter-1